MENLKALRLTRLEIVVEWYKFMSFHGTKPCLFYILTAMINQTYFYTVVRQIYARGFAWTVTLLMTILSPTALPLESTSTFSIFDSVSKPSMTRPKTVFFPSSVGCGANVTKNCEPFVSGPLFAILTIPRALCFSDGRISSSNEPPHMDGDVFDFGSSAGAPDWKMKEGMMRWMGELL
jgi:hypothetical protein